jgi:hypothetical protein
MKYYMVMLNGDKVYIDFYQFFKFVGCTEQDLKNMGIEYIGREL